MQIYTNLREYLAEFCIPLGQLNVKIIGEYKYIYVFRIQ